MFSRKFIKATENFCTYEAPVAAPYLRKTFMLDAAPEKASFTVTSTGFYRLWVNGEEITASLLAPGIVNPDETVIYDVYDLAGKLKAGKNVLAFQLGNGMSNQMGGYIWDFEKALFRSAPKLAFALETENGCMEADTDIRTAPSPIYYDDLRSGEFYDANAEIAGWMNIDFDDSAWANAVKAEPARGEAIENTADKVKVIKELTAEKHTDGRIIYTNKEIIREDSYKQSETTFYKPDENETGCVFCFAENRACLPRLRIRGRKGQKIVIQAAEYFTESGEMDFTGIQSFYPFGFAQRDIYICKGEGVEEYVPSFTYHGARYFMLLGADADQIADDTLTMLVVNSDLADRGGFECSDQVANALMQAAHNSDLSNFVWFPTDCPHREKNGWTGDAAMSAEHMLQTIAPEKSWKQWLKQICAAQKPDGQIPGIVPTGGWGYAWGSGPAWDQVLVELAYQTYIYRGETDLFEEVSDNVFRYLNYAAGKRDEFGLLHYGLGDWVHAMRTDMPVCPLEVSDTATIYRFCRVAAKLWRVIGKPLQAAFADALGDELYRDFRANLIDFNTMTVAGNCQAAQAIGLYYGLFEPAEAVTAYAHLVELVHEADDAIDCGMIGVRILFRVLAQHGDADLAWKLILREKAPGYGMWITEYAFASMPETLDASYNGGCGASLNHHFLGDYSGFFIAHIAGLQINPRGNDAAFVRVTPGFVEGLESASAWYDTVKGKVSVAWKREGEDIVLTVKKAEDVKGELVLPNGYALKIMPKEHAYYKADNRRTVRLEAGEYLIARK